MRGSISYIAKRQIINTWSVMIVVNKYPSELHEFHNDYPLTTEKLEISQNMFSKYCFNIANEYGI